MDVGKINQEIKQDLTWLQKHERLLIVFITLVALVFLGMKYLNYRVQHDQIASSNSAQVLQLQKEQNDKLASQMVLEQSQYQAELKMWQQQNQALLGQINAKNAALKEQQEKDKTLPLPDLAIRWKTIVPLKDGDLAVSSTGISVTDQGARDTVSQLERVPVLQSDVNNLTVLNSNKDTQISKLNDLNSGLTTQVGGLQTQIKDTENKCNADIKLLKDKERKSKIKTFFAGTIVGAVGKILIKTFLL